MNVFNLNTYPKNIFVDFDNTMYVWDNSPRTEPSTTDHIDWLASSIKDPFGQYYDADNLNDCLIIEYLKKAKNAGSKIILFTWTTFSSEGKAKFNFINSIHSNLLDDWISVSSIDAKVEYLLAFERAGNDRNDMLVIDDDVTAIDKIYKAKFNIQTPQCIMNLIYKQIREDILCKR